MLRRSAAFVVLALFALGCSDEAAPTPQGSLYIEVGPAADTPPGTQCPSIGHTANIGVPPPTANTPGQRVELGGCKVTGDGAFNGKISQGTISFTMFGQAAQGGTGKGSLVYYDDKLATTMESALDGCDVFINEGALQVAGGRIWAKFSCAHIIEEPNYYCKASGVFVMENCDE